MYSKEKFIERVESEAKRIGLKNLQGIEEETGIYRNNFYRLKKKNEDYLPIQHLLTLSKLFKRPIEWLLMENEPEEDKKLDHKMAELVKHAEKTPEDFQDLLIAMATGKAKGCF